MDTSSTLPLVKQYEGFPIKTGRVTIFDHTAGICSMGVFEKMMHFKKIDQHIY
jgi:hypothetical protein